MKGDFQQRADDMRKATAAGRHFVDKNKKVASLQTSEETPPVAAMTLAPDFDGHLFPISVDSEFGRRGSAPRLLE